MKTKKFLNAMVNLTFFLVLPVLIFSIVLFNSCAAGKKSATLQSDVAPTPAPPPPQPPAAPRAPVPGQKEGDAYIVVDEMPEFKGGDEALLKYIAVNTQYPKEAKEKNIQGKVITRFMVKEDGTVSDVSILKSVDPLLDAEALKVVSTIPPFIPGKLHGVAVPVWYMVPITFTLRNDAPQRASRYIVNGNDTVYSYTKEMPQYKGGSEALAKFKAENIKYPPKIKKLGIEGMVIVNFNIEKNGSVSDIKIAKGTSPALDAEAIRVTKLLPPWQPGKENGKPVKFNYMVFYDFLLTPRVPPVHEEGTPYVVVEEMPVFPGGDSALLVYIGKNTKYPEVAKANKTEGRVIVRFCVTEVGGIDKVSILKGVDPELDAEATRVVKTLPKFKPGMQGGKPVNVWYMVPITFGLSKPAEQTAANLPSKSPAPPPPPQGYDELPVFKGGEKAMYKFINSNLVYPKTAKEKNISGTVNLMFSINTDGTIGGISLIKGVDPELNSEAIRVVKLLPAWKPGKLAGTSVKVWYPVSVAFKLK